MIDLRMNEQEHPLESEPTAEMAWEPRDEVAMSDEGGDAAETPTPPLEATPPPFHPAPLYQKLLPVVLALFLVTSDQITKRYIVNTLDVYESRAPIPALDNFFQFTHIHNTGAAFGMFPAAGFVFTIIAIVVAIAIVVYTRRLDAGHYLLRIALGLQLGGAVGNLIDRLSQGYVTDFIDFIPFPFIFNIADLSIVSGVVVLFYLMLLETVEERRQKQAAAAADNERSNDPPNLNSTTHPFADSESL